ncbi:MAG TPA: YdcF family protein [Pirellulales bacterium]|nr:YdcF family protein [Pirellulales bacterium]
MSVALKYGRWLLALFVLLTAVWLGRASILPRAAYWLNVGETPRPCDYVVVLPGGEETRPFVAAALFRAGLARTAVVPRVIGTPDTNAGTARAAHEIIRDVLILRGIRSDDVILIGTGSTSTYGDALALREFLRGRPAATVAIVTHHFHTRRARWVFRKVLGDRADDIYMVAAPVDDYTEENWWQSRQGTGTYLGEFAKLAGYLVWYGDTWVWSGGGLLVALAAIVVYRCHRNRRQSIQMRASRSG